MPTRVFGLRELRPQLCDWAVSAGTSSAAARHDRYGGPLIRPAATFSPRACIWDTTFECVIRTGRGRSGRLSRLAHFEDLVDVFYLHQVVDRQQPLEPGRPGRGYKMTPVFICRPESRTRTTRRRSPRWQLVTLQIPDRQAGRAGHAQPARRKRTGLLLPLPRHSFQRT